MWEWRQGTAQAHTHVRILPCLHTGYGSLHSRFGPPPSPTHTPKGLIMGLMSSRPVCVVRSWMCLCVCVLSERPANTLSPGGSLIYKASNEVQQRRRARTSLRLIVCLFTFLFHSFPLPTSRGGGGHGWKSSAPRVKGFQQNKSKPGSSKFRIVTLKTSKMFYDGTFTLPSWLTPYHS